MDEYQVQVTFTLPSCKVVVPLAINMTSADDLPQYNDYLIEQAFDALDAEGLSFSGFNISVALR